MQDLTILEQSREEIIAEIANSTNVDLVVIGGGIHGACFARLAAESGLKTVLLEKSDYASGTSSRSSKMAHGGLRYLELLDFEQVFEGVKCREQLFAEYPSLVKPHPFYIPIPANDWFLRLKLKLGLTLYDFMLKNPKHKHYWVNKLEVDRKVPELTKQKLSGCYCYTDGILDDSKLVMANIQKARLSGAMCLNYAAIDELGKQVKNGQREVRWQDQLTNKTYQINAKSVVNCCGPWANNFCNAPIKYSRGSHVLFSRPWTGPALFLPMPGKARYYFVWPHFAGTLVGTTEREVSSLQDNPEPSADEIQEILDRLTKDLPDSQLDRAHAHYAFAGIRTLPLRLGAKSTAQLSRKHIWLQDQNLFSLVGGKLTTAEWTAQEGLAKILKLLKHTPTQAKKDSDLSSISLMPLAQQLKMEQVATVEDYFRRRSGLEYMPGNGLKEIDVLRKDFEQHLGVATTDSQINDYKIRLARIAQILGKN
jgi:glycerol-3-phosphate dehydrogenase